MKAAGYHSRYMSLSNPEVPTPAWSEVTGKSIFWNGGCRAVTSRGQGVSEKPLPGPFPTGMSSDEIGRTTSILCSAD